MPHVVVIGGNFAGCHAVRTLYSISPDVEVTQVALSSHAYYNPVAPRLLVEPGLVDKAFFPLDEFVEKHLKGKGKFVHGTATKANLDENEVEVKTAGGETQKIKYDFLVVASGTRSLDAGFKINQSYEEAKKGIVEWSEKAKKAELILILGGGPTGVELAGELAHDFKKKITMYTGDKLPLAPANLGKGAQAKLEKLGVEVVNGVRYTKIEPSGSGYKVVFDNGGEKTFDLVLNLTVYKPYSDFLPENVKSKPGFLETDDRLVVKGYPNVFGLGDIVAGSGQSIVDLKMGQLPVFAATAKSDIFKQLSRSKKYKPVRHTILVPISRNGGEGRLFGWWQPNFVVWLLKSRDFMLGNASGEFA